MARVAKNKTTVKKTPKKQKSADVDITKLKTLKSQKTANSTLLESLDSEYSELKHAITAIETIPTILDLSKSAKIQYSEFVGYHYGCLNSNLDIIDSSIANLQRFSHGELDKIDHGGRNMFISLWYMLGTSGLDSAKISLTKLQNLEGEIIDFVKNNDETVDLDATFH